VIHSIVVVAVPCEKHFQVSDIAVDCDNADRLLEVSASFGTIGVLAVFNSVEGVFASVFQAANITAHGLFGYLSGLIDFFFFGAPAFKQAQCLFIALHGLWAKAFASTVVHKFINVEVEVLDDCLLFAHKKTLPVVVLS
jgi:phosphoribosyl-AMP cyclohydrolase